MPEINYSDKLFKNIDPEVTDFSPALYEAILCELEGIVRYGSSDYLKPIATKIGHICDSIIGYIEIRGVETFYSPESIDSARKAKKLQDELTNKLTKE